MDEFSQYNGMPPLDMLILAAKRASTTMRGVAQELTDFQSMLDLDEMASELDLVIEEVLVKQHGA